MNAYKLLLRPLLFGLDPERAHDAMTGLLERLQGSAPARRLLSALYGAPERPVTVAGLRFPNPVGLAAGFDKGCRLAGVLPCLGFGFLELGTVTFEGQPGNPKPRIFRLPEQRGLLNRLGFNNPGARAAAERLAALSERPVPVGVNLGKGAKVPLEEAPDEYRRSLELLYPHGDYFVLNISSPNTSELRRLHERARLEALLEAQQNFIHSQPDKKPLFVKVSPDLDDGELKELAYACVGRGIGIVATNTTTSREGLPERWKASAGGVSGRPLAARAAEVLGRLRSLTGGKVPLISVGGIFGPEDARERLKAGADLVQVYTGWIYEGPGLVRRIVKGLL